MAITTRQTSLLVQQDWTKIYQSFREADFQSFDFETLRRSMIEYLRTYYPEDFNDFTESSEYIALIDLIAFLGQSLAFRTDLNARENFIDTAERRDSILKLAKLVSYNPKRSIPASGYLKFDSISSTESILDSTGTNLSNLLVVWNDTTNENWLEQWTAVINAALVSTQVIGKPGGSQVLNSIKTDEYNLDILTGLSPTYPFTSTIAGAVNNFEVVAPTMTNQSYIYEQDPSPTNSFSFLYRNDNQGNGSNNTGYFLYFKQGELKSLDFSITESLPNRVVNINFDNINNTDVWLYSLNSNGTVGELWKQVASVNNINVIYNNSTERNLYSVGTRANDQIDLVFGDGSFTNIPLGNYRLYFRVGNNLSYKITPDEMSTVTIALPYRGRAGKAETLTVRASLKYTVTNATARETLEEIRQKAPQQYYTQNRMITGEDYNILPYTLFNNVLKAKALNRTSSGISRYLDVVDASGKYSSTNIFSQDGLIYQEDYDQIINFQFTSSSEANFAVKNLVKPLISQIPVRHLYYNTATRFTAVGATISVSGNLIEGQAYEIVSVGTTDFLALGSVSNNIGTTFIATAEGAGSGTVKILGSWTESTNTGSRSTGLFTSPSYTYIKTGALIKFVAPAGYYFDAQNKLKLGSVITEYQKTSLWASVIDIDNPASSTTIATLSVVVPTGAIIGEIIPVFANDWSNQLTATLVNNVLSYKTFGIRYDVASAEWKIVEEQNLSNANFSLTNAGDTTSLNKDSSWFLKLSFANQEYTVTVRGINYYFESERETRFYFDPNIKVYDTKTASTKQDAIKVLRINTKPDSADSLFYSQIYRIWNKVIEEDGYENNNKILITFPDDNYDNVPDNPDLFDILVDPETNSETKFVYFLITTDEFNFRKLEPIDPITIVGIYPTSVEILSDISLYTIGTIFYAKDENIFYESTGSNLIVNENYVAKIGRQSLMFQYTHNAPNNRRIDPSPNNIMDLYILTKTYSDDYFAYLTDTSNKLAEPIPPTTEELKTEFGSIENYKPLSDSIVYNTGIFKPLFGSKAPTALQATFKVVKNPNVNISDNDVKSQVVAAINTFFDITNWDFGETFYFSELSAYLHSALSPNISSIIIVPSSSLENFGSLFQINAEPNEIVVSAATVDNVQIINAITAGQINRV